MFVLQGFFLPFLPHFPFAAEKEEAAEDRKKKPQTYGKVNFFFMFSGFVRKMKNFQNVKFSHEDFWVLGEKTGFQ